jgi:hypothetical protein
MIIVRLIGGLGNQLFQYATARQLAFINNTQLKLDISGFETYKLHAYSLQNFKIQEGFATLEEVAKLKPKGFLSKIILRIDARHRFPWRSWKIERHFHYDPHVLTLRGNIYLDGYWQSERYFKHIENIIRQELVVNTDLDSKNMATAQHIEATQSICLHIRRGDYASNPVTLQLHGVCSLEYYLAAANRIANGIDDPHFFIFSDDPVWAEKNLKLPYPYTLVSHNKADKNYEDLRLMSLCRHFIIANSTFSWWGAWLSSHPDKMVIAPAKWFNDPTINDYDLIPSSWLRL